MYGGLGDGGCRTQIQGILGRSPSSDGRGGVNLALPGGGRI